MLSSFAPSWRRSLLGAAVLAAGLLSAPATLPGLTICRDFDGIPAPLVGNTPDFDGNTVTTFYLFENDGGGYFGDVGQITDVDVFLKLNHPRVTDLDIWVRHVVFSEDGLSAQVTTIPMLVGDGCSTGDYNQNTVFNQDIAVYLDDEAVAPISFACDRSIPTLAGRHTSSTAGIDDIYAARDIDARVATARVTVRNSLTGFEGTPAIERSRWDLVVIDRGTTGSGGSLVEWCMHFNSVEEGDVAPREETATLVANQSGNDFLSISDHIASGLSLLNYLDWDNRVFERRQLDLSTYANVFPQAQPPVFESTLLYRNQYENLRRSGGTEFLRLDTAPTRNGGDGRLTVADWVQVTRYAAGGNFDDPVPAKGPLSMADRVVRGGTSILPRGVEVEVPIIMRSRGVEHEIAFGVQFDPNLLEFVRADRGECVPKNAIFQLNNEDLVTTNSVVGLQVGLLPDQTWLCDLTPRSPVVTTASGRQIPDIRLVNTATTPTDIEVQLTGILRGDGSFQIYAASDQGFPTTDLVVMMEYKTGELSYERVSPTDSTPVIRTASDFTASASAAQISGRGFIFTRLEAPTAVQLPPITTANPGFGDGVPDSPGDIDPFLGYLVAELEFFPVGALSPEIIKRVELKRNMFGVPPVELANVAEELNALISTRFYSNSENISVRDAALRADACVDGNEISVVVSVGTENAFPITGVGMRVTYPDTLTLNLADTRNGFIDGNGFFGALTPTAAPTSSNGVTVATLEGSDENSSYKNGDLFRLVFTSTTPLSASNPPLIVIGPPLGSSSIIEWFEIPRRTNPTSLSSTQRAFFTTSACATTKDSTEVAAPKTANINWQGTLSTSFEAVNLLSAPYTFNVHVNGTGLPSDAIRSYDFLLTYDATVATLVSTADGGAGFGAAPTTTPLNSRANYETIRVRGNSPTSTYTMTGGRLATLQFQLNLPAGAILNSPPSFHLSTAPPISQEVEIAKFVFRAKNGTGSAVTALNFVQDPIFFTAPTVRNVAGVPVSAEFADVAVTIIDNADERPTVRVNDTVLTSGTAQEVQIVLDSVGVENAAGFRVAFNRTDLQLVGVKRGADIPDAGFFYTLPNENDAAGLAVASEVRILTSLQPGKSFQRGERILASLVFVPRATTETFTTNLNFSELVTNASLLEEEGLTGNQLLNSPTKGEVVNPFAIPVVTNFPQGTITIVRPDCTYTLTPGTASFEPEGGSGSFNVTTLNGCPWRAVSTAGWLRIVGSSSGFESGVVNYTVASNNSLAPRTATIQVAGQNFTVTQAACSFVLNPGELIFSGTGGTGEVQVVSQSVCTWQLAADVPWIRFTSPSVGTGPTTVRFTVDANVGQPRSGNIYFAGTNPATPGVQKVLVRQEICSYEINPSQAAETFAPAGGTGSFTVTASQAFCPWNAVSSAEWLVVTNPSGSGNGTIQYTVRPNTEIPTEFDPATGLPRPRVATITVAGTLVYTVRQAFPACSYAVEPSRTVVDAAAQNGNIYLIASDPACSWSITDNAAWLTITGLDDANTGAGSATLKFTVTRNDTTAARTATVSVTRGSGAVLFTFTITQLGPDNSAADEFYADAEGWTFDSPAGFTAPTFTHDPSRTPDGFGRIRITATNNTNTFGWWQSPAIVLSSDVTENDLFRADVIVSSQVAVAGQTPIFRIRTTTSDFQQSDVMVVTSTGNGPLSPTAGSSRSLQHYFTVPSARFFSSGVQSFSVFFEMLNFGGEDAANGDIALESIVITRFDQGRLGTPTVERRFVLAQPADQSGWQQDVPSVFRSPQFGVDDRGLSVTSDFNGTTNPPVTIGFLTRNTGVQVRGDRLYKVSFLVSARSESALAVRKSLVPTFRLRVNDSTFASSAYVNIESINDASRVPTFLEKQTYNVWYQGTPQIAGAGSPNLIASFDYLLTPESFTNFQDYIDASDIVLVLELVEITSYSVLD